MRFWAVSDVGEVVCKDFDDAWEACNVMVEYNGAKYAAVVLRPRGYTVGNAHDEW